MSLFRNIISSLIRPAKKTVYSIDDPKGVAIHTQLRIGLSALNSHNYSHNFRHTVKDGIEGTEHFLLHCHAYDDDRCDLLGVITKSISKLSNQTLVQIMLQGDKRFIENKIKTIMMKIKKLGINAEIHSYIRTFLVAPENS